MVETTNVAGALSATAIVDVGAWEVIEVKGADRLSFLHRLLTVSLDKLAPGEGRRALLLTIKGQVVAELLVAARAEGVLLVAPPGHGAATAATLGRYAVMDDVTLTPLPDLRPLAIYGANAGQELAAAGASVPAAVAKGAPLAHSDVAWSGAASSLWTMRVPGYGGDGFWLFAPASVLETLLARLQDGGVARLNGDEAEVRRIVAGEPKFGAEITSDVFPMEVGLDPLIDYSKGCYLGQEPIVRIRDRGHINWRLVGLRLAEAGSAAVGDRLETDTRPKAGRITSLAAIPGSPPVALALLHVSVPEGTVVRVRHEEETVNADVVAIAPQAAASGVPGT